MAEKLLIIMVNTDPSSGSESYAPFFQAAVAASMEYTVEIVLNGRTSELAIKGVAETIMVHPESDRTVYSYIKEAHDAGVSLKVCTQSVEILGDDLIPEVEEQVGSVYLISAAMDEDTVVFTY